MQHFTQLYTTLQHFAQNIHNFTQLYTTQQQLTHIYKTCQNSTQLLQHYTQLHHNKQNKPLQHCTQLYTTLLHFTKLPNISQTNIQHLTQLYKPTSFTTLPKHFRHFPQLDIILYNLSNIYMTSVQNLHNIKATKHNTLHKLGPTIQENTYIALRNCTTRYRNLTKQTLQHFTKLVHNFATTKNYKALHKFQIHIFYTTFHNLTNTI